MPACFGGRSIAARVGTPQRPAATASARQHLEQAVEAARRGLEINPKHLYSQTSLALALNNMNDNEQKILKKAVSDVFANPNAALPELKGDSDGATDKMNKYLAMVQSGLRSGVIKASDQTKYEGLSPTKAELTALGQAIKAQTDSLSNISSKLQLAVNQYQSNKTNIEQFVAQLQSAFSNAIRNTISKMA